MHIVDCGEWRNIYTNSGEIQDNQSILRMKYKTSNYLTLLTAVSAAWVNLLYFRGLYAIQKIYSISSQKQNHVSSFV